MKAPLDTTFDHKDPYQILGVTSDAAPAAIRKAYLELAKRNHPNLFATDPEKYRASNTLMQDINAAYGLLSEPARREAWDRKHPGTRRPAPRPAPGPPPRQSVHYDSEQVHLVIRKYNEFVGSLRTPAERQQAVRKIQAFQSSREGSAFIQQLVASYYQEVIDLLNLGRRISFYDDGLVEIMFLYAGALEIAPSEVFITYAYLVYRQTHGKVPAPPGAKKRPRPGAAPTPMLRLRHDPGSAKPAPAKDIGTRIYDWLMAKPGSGRR